MFNSMEKNKMNKKLGQALLLVVVVSIFGVLSSHAQKTTNGYKFPKGDTVIQSGTMLGGEGLKSKNGQYVALMQPDGNFCLYIVNNDTTLKTKRCLMTVGSEDKKGHIFTMQNDGNLVLYNKKAKHLWSTDTYQGDRQTRVGKFLRLENDGRLLLYSWDNRTAIYDFGEQKRLY